MPCTRCARRSPWAGRSIAGSTRYRVTPKEFALSTLVLRMAGKELRAAELAGTVPRLQRRDGETIVPLAFRWAGLRGDLGRYGLADCRGELLADLYTAGNRRWLAGRAVIAGGQLLVAGAPAGAPAVEELPLVTSEKSGSFSFSSGKLISTSWCGKRHITAPVNLSSER